MKNSMLAFLVIQQMLMITRSWGNMLSIIINLDNTEEYTDESLRWYYDWNDYNWKWEWCNDNCEDCYGWSHCVLCSPGSFLFSYEAGTFCIRW